MLNFFTPHSNISFLASKKLYDCNGVQLKEKPAIRMKEDYFARTRNGHLLKDTFDPKTNTLDIYSSGLYPANVLSNLAFKPFVFDDVECSSIEGFLQSLKIKDPEEQRKVCILYGGSARKKSKKYLSWTIDKKLYWQGKEYERNSIEYKELLYRAFKTCYEQNVTFRNALNSTKGINLSHNKGKDDINDTVITSKEFIEILLKIRDEND